MAEKISVLSIYEVEWTYKEFYKLIFLIICAALSDNIFL